MVVGSNRLLHFTPAALVDLQGIWAYTELMWSMVQAEKYYNLLIEGCYRISMAPLLFGRKRRGLGKNIYSYTVERHVVFFRPTSDEVSILRVLHGSMRFTREMFEDE